MSVPFRPALPHLGTRLLWSGAGILALLGAGAGRLFDVQVVRHEHYRARAWDQWYTDQTIPATRGRIYFLGGEIAAISREQAPSVFADPKLVEDAPRTAGVLAHALDLPAAEVLGRLESYRQRGKRFCWIKRLVTPLERARVAASELPGIDVRYESDRAYPRGALAGHVIGFAGRDGNGLEGIERRFEPLLAGTPGKRRFARDALGRAIAMPASAHTPPVPGCDLTLTIDAYAQDVAEREVADAVARWDARWGVALVLDVATGAVRAWAQVPTYDPGDPTASPVDARRNRALTDPFAPGSAMKMFSVGTALLTGAVSPDTTIDCAGGHWRYLGRQVEDFHGYGALSVRDVLMKSSNIGSVKCVLRMGTGSDKKAAAMDAWRKLAAGVAPFGFGARTGIELAGEAPGYVGAQDASKRSYHTPISVAMGYECLVSPVQLAAAVNTIANDGVWVPPHVVERIEQADGGLVPVPGRPAEHRVWPSAHAALMREILATVVSSHGTARHALVEGLQLAGKTSTVKKLVNGHFADDKSRCLFSAFAPADKPVYTCIVVIDEPRHGGRKEQTGGRVAAPPAARILATLLGATPPTPVEPSVRRTTPTAPAGAATPPAVPGGRPAPAAPAAPRRVADNDADDEMPKPWVSSDLQARADRQRRDAAPRRGNDE